MLRSMYAGISGMKNSQTKLDVIGNNIANVNTSGYKKSNINFQDMLSQTTSAAQGPGNGRGGINASQVGLGSQEGAISNTHTPGSRQTTNNPLDFAIQGDGMFVVQEGDTNYYTRAGNFYLDAGGNIVNANGYYLQAEGGGNLTIPENAESFSVQPDGTVTYTDANENTEEVGRIALAKFSNPAGLEKVGGSLYAATNNAGLVGTGLEGPGANGTGEIISGALEMSNVDLSEEFTEMITAQRSFQANTRIITTSDEILQELVNLKR
ncbi:flagellar basal-body rod protein FlgG [Oceanobacillus oncorhynchi subsp. incaldanensis]|uniref:Flagellar basal-body rod protein FlgG n=2 Tax=Oceanobacillus TaxID=182709 RepID=A0A0A1MMM9_9BACI|nr:flagellar basal body rod protein FlgG [Oceanobacillus oncorhynchi]MDM8099265.1 flagellar basal body rod protein FlgG [Oceanobacillus oncorhynchi]UUI38603.1 flagellar basal body rod protein FlgG [Oceanobacillus oncorhynchi]GIO18385.1 flagellar basal-body rod protein FlgG [Oceanobacillus oncorhynchi subsp. incaldanensis]CEI84293.1 Flagellar basal-body rod protein FlgG [Oceanobacillus oncorhynchi]